MPKIKSAKKALRKSIKKNKSNANKMQSLRNTIKTYKKAVLNNNEDVQSSLSKAYKALDKSAKTGLIKKNKANRLKSVLAKKNKISA